MPSMRHRLRSKPDELKKLPIRTADPVSSGTSLVPRKRGRPPGSRSIQSDCQVALPSLPALELLDVHVSCPVLSSVLTRSLNSDPMIASELHEMQREVELMLTRTALCYKGVLNFHNRLCGKATSPAPLVSEKQEPISCNGIGPTKVKHVSSPPGTSLANCRSSPIEVDQHDSTAPTFGGCAGHAQPSPTSSRTYQVTNNTAPDRFWAFVETYLKTPTEDDVDYLNRLIDDCDPDGHCALSEQSTSSADCLQHVDSSSAAGQPCAKLKVHSNCTNGTDWFRQRRSASHRDDAPSALDSVCPLPDSTADGSAWFPSISKLSKYVVSSLYRPVTRRQSLEDEVSTTSKPENHGECSSTSMEAADDDVASELIERQAELRILQAANIATLLRIKHKADAMRCNEAKVNSLHQIEHSLISLSRKLTVAHPTFGDISKKEADLIWKLIRDRQRLKDEIDAN